MKKKNQNWFQQQEAKQNVPVSKKTAPATDAYKAVQKAPILELKLTPVQEEQHYSACLAYAMKMSDPSSEAHFTVHMDLNGTLHFDMAQDDDFKRRWFAKELLCLIDLPRNWKTMVLEVDEEDEEDFDLSNPEERFDYLYETGMSVSEA